MTVPDQKTPWETRVKLATQQDWARLPKEDQERVRRAALVTAQAKARLAGVHGDLQEKATEFTLDGFRWLRLKGVVDRAKPVRPRD